MGNRANYVIVENGQARIFFSRWGALTIPSVMLSGPEATLAYIRQLTSDGQLLDTVWAEGGVLVNVDTHHVLFWGGEKIATRPYLRRLLLAVLPLLWPGWSIDWALFGAADLARGIGWDVSLVLDNDYVATAFLTGEEAVLTEAQLVEALHAHGPKAVLSLRGNTGEVKDHLLMLEEVFTFDDFKTHYFLAASYQVLSLGPRLLSLLPAESPTPLPREGSEQEPENGAYVDEVTRTIWVWEKETLDPRYLETVARRWPGWQVWGHVEGLVRHASLSGRDPTTVKISDQQATQELLREITGTRSIDPLRLLPAIQEKLPPEELQGMQFGIGFFSADTPPLAPQERRELLERLLLDRLEGDNDVSSVYIDENLPQ